MLAHTAQAEICFCRMQTLAAEKKASRRQALDLIHSKAVETCLAAPLVEAAAAGSTPACISLAHGWCTYVYDLYAQVRSTRRCFTGVQPSGIYRLPGTLPGCISASQSQPDMLAISCSACTCITALHQASAHSPAAVLTHWLASAGASEWGQAAGDCAAAADPAGTLCCTWGAQCEQ